MTSKRTNNQFHTTPLRERLSGLRGREYWRSLEELAETKEFQERLEREFPQGAAQWLDPVSRRNFLKLMGASLALAGVVGCTRQPDERILPYTNNPDLTDPQRLAPTEVTYYATAMVMGGFASGLLVESYLGRPLKAEGNPEHPASLGGTDVFAQASLLTFYDPERSQTVVNNGTSSSWEAFVNAAGTAMNARSGAGGAGMHILTEAVSSPTLASQIRSLQSRYPRAVWHQYEPVSDDNAKQGAQMAFGRNVFTRYEIAPANILLSLDADFLASGPGGVRYAHDFASGRRIWEHEDQMNRLYAIEATPSVTGSVADHRLSVRPSEVEAYARIIAQRLGVNVPQSEGLTLSEQQTAWIDGLVSDLQASQGASVVVAGDAQPPVVHALAHAINRALGNVGTTVFYTEPVMAQPANAPQTQIQSLTELVNAMNNGQVEMLVILSGNPAYTAPADLGFADALANVPVSIHLGMDYNETAALSTWHIPEAHYLESWGDARAFDGTATIIQPLIAPLFDGKTASEVVAALNGQADMAAYDLVRSFWQNWHTGGDFEGFWQISLDNGMVAGTGLPPINVNLSLNNLPAPQPISNQFELVFRPDPSVWDGRFTNNGWLQELPRPWTRLVWDNAALISPRTALELFNTSLDFSADATRAIFSLDTSRESELTPRDYEELSKLNGRMIELTYQGRTLSVPVWIMPGHPNNSISLHLGYGRSLVGVVGEGVGFNAYALRTSDAPWFGPASVTPTGEYHQLVSTQDHHSMEGRAIVRAGTLEQYREEPGFIGALAEVPNHPERSLFQDLFPYDNGHSWGMVIDLNTCIGCHVCTIACQAENNIPVVGKDEAAIGREMHWIRVDRYYGGDLEDPVLYQQPMACVHCELAPCEIVCPVNATVHDHEGINTMVYNRCVGTRYCSNNCPYKVRRFNFFWYNDIDSPSLKLLQNPEVTVRSRGVMEKCTYCIQRIQEVTIPAKNEGREVMDGEIVPACAQACPTNAITFGNLNDESSQVYAQKQLLLNYGVLEELNFFPRTTYLGRISNPNPAIGPQRGMDYPNHGVPYGTDHGHGDGHGGGTEGEEMSDGESHGGESQNGQH
jgi:molybdopterin-containing oxidoreductase family iron-sulfur binding subunit